MIRTFEPYDAINILDKATSAGDYESEKIDEQFTIYHYPDLRVTVVSDGATGLSRFCYCERETPSEIKMAIEREFRNYEAARVK
jgi:hypothetical protein